MKLVEINWNPTNRQLRQFGIICLFALPLLGWLWGGSLNVMGLLGVVGLVIAVAGLALPKAVKPIFLALTLVTTPIGIVIGELAMLLIYFGIFLPIGLIFRVARRDALQMKIDRKTSTYWQSKLQPNNAGSYFRQS